MNQTSEVLRLAAKGTDLLITSEVRLLLAVIAYNLGTLVLRVVLPFAIQSWTRLAENHLTRTLFGQILGPVAARDHSGELATDFGNWRHPWTSVRHVCRAPGRPTSWCMSWPTRPCSMTWRATGLTA